MQKLALIAPAPDITRQGSWAGAHEEAKPVFSAAVQALINGYREHGYRSAAIDPMGVIDARAAATPELDPSTYGISADDAALYVHEFAAQPRTHALAQWIAHLRSAYCGSLALESLHLRSPEQRQWLHTRMEARVSQSPASAASSLSLLTRLAAVEAFEHQHSDYYKVYKQFSMQGSETLVLLLRSVLEKGAQAGVEDIVLGLPHRGRLNMMLNALGLPPEELLSLFSANPERSLAAWDIKDHAGCSRRMDVAGKDVRILLAHNPSHLESVSPIICGMARALQDRKADGSSKRVLPVLVHGDASFTAQGIVCETLNLSQTRGYGVGGSLHLILNNQIGSTIAHPRDARSTLHASDMARAIDAPVLHVNADDPEAVVFAAAMATDYRMRFGSDIVVDHVGYRRGGHFVGDDPTITQPAMQRRIDRHRSVVDGYARELARRGVCADDEGERARAAARGGLAAVRDQLAASGRKPGPLKPPAQVVATTVHTAVPESRLRALVGTIAELPPHLVPHATVETMLDDWTAIARGEARPVDWRLAENLAYASLLSSGFNVRLTGLDVGRGTFKHRQHLWHDQAAETDWQNVHIPLAHVGNSQGVFALFESPLSEEAVVGFEYGYSVQCGRDLVVWEAQFGDFVNNAQVIIDQYIASGEAKWGYRSGLVLMLPHGLDGWGPEHSCAFLGRFLQLCAEDNMVVAMPSSAAQMYHLIRRQAVMEQRRPLIVMTPKPWFYACKPSYSSLAQLAHGEFQALIEDIGVDRATVDRVVLTSGKLYYDLAAGRSQSGSTATAIARVEQLYPFPAPRLSDYLSRFPRLTSVAWAQEEPRNHGAWHLVRDSLEAAVPAGVTLSYAGRADAAASATCNAGQHAVEQQAVVAEALGAARARPSV